jgi:hypothetical protein
MVHGNKIGRAINDEGIKFVKKLINKKPISFEGRYWADGDIKMQVANIRKYQKSYGPGFVYEVDVKVSFIKERWYRSSNRAKNDRVRRYKNEKLLREELEYFNINDLVISKVQYV